MSPVVVIGYQGQLASEIRKLTFNNPAYTFVPKEDLPAIDDINSLLKVLRPKFVINCAAYTAVDKAESDQAACFRLNRDLPAALARASRTTNFHLIHFSTDYVFAGDRARPYTEDDPVNPVNVYGQSKLEGENRIMELSDSATIVRTSWVYSEFGNNFLKTMLKLADGEKPLRVIGDQIGSPTWARDIAHLVTGPLLHATGQRQILNYSNAGETTWFEFAKAIMREWGKQKTVTAISSAEFPTAAQRPKFSLLSKEKIQQLYQLQIPTWQQSLRICHENWGQ